MRGRGWGQGEGRVLRPGAGGYAPLSRARRPRAHALRAWLLLGARCRPARLAALRLCRAPPTRAHPAPPPKPFQPTPDNPTTCPLPGSVDENPYKVLEIDMGPFNRDLPRMQVRGLRFGVEVTLPACKGH